MQAMFDSPLIWRGTDENTRKIRSHHCNRRECVCYRARTNSQIIEKISEKFSKMPAPSLKNENHMRATSASDMQSISLDERKIVCVCEQRKAQENILFSICLRLRYVSIVCFSAQRKFSFSKKPMKKASKNAHGSVDEIVNKMIELMNVSFGYYLCIFVGFPSFIRVKFQLFCMRSLEKKNGWN